MSPRVTLRHAGPADAAFLLEVYAETRRDELSALDWDDAARAAFLHLQHDAQMATYRGRHPDGHFLIVRCDDESAGRLFLAAVEGQVRLVDLALLPRWRRQGVGGALLAAVTEGADAAGLAVCLHVETWSPARRLYERHGFSVTATDAVYVRMERPARSPGSTGRQLNTAS